MIPTAEEARKMGFGEIEEKTEEEIRMAARAGEDSVVVLGATDHVNSSETMEDFITHLEDKGYHALLEGPNLFINW